MPGSSRQRPGWAWFPKWLKNQVPEVGCGGRVGQSQQKGRSENRCGKLETASLFSSCFMFEGDDLRAFAGTSAQRFLEAGWTAMLSQEIVERFIGELLERLHVFGREQPQLLPGLFVKLHAFANHGCSPNEFIRRHSRLAKTILGRVQNGPPRLYEADQAASAE
jgi:hypothetical protein